MGPGRRGTGDSGRAADLLVAGAEVWERGLFGAFPGWGLLAAADALLNAGRPRRTRLRHARRAAFDAGGRDAGGCALPRSSGC